MKITYPILAIIVTLTLAFAGCGKSNKDTSNAPATTAMGSMVKLQKSLPTATPDIQANMEKIAFGVRYGDYPAALAELDKLAANPSLNDAQKKAATETIENVKKALAAAPAKTP